MKPCLWWVQSLTRGQAVFLTSFIRERNPFLRLGEKALVGKDVWEGTHKLQSICTWLVSWKQAEGWEISKSGNYLFFSKLEPTNPDWYARYGSIRAL